MSNKIASCLQPEKRRCQNLAVPVVPLPLVASTSVTYRLPENSETCFKSFASFDDAASFLREAITAGYFVTVLHA